MAGTQLLDQIIVHHHFGDAAVRQAADEAGPADVGLIDLQSEPGREQHADRRNHTQQSALLVGGFQYDHGQTDIGAILGSDALNERALLALGARRCVTANLPVVVNGLDRALRPRGFVHRNERRNRDEREQRSHRHKKHPRGE